MFRLPEGATAAHSIFSATGAQSDGGGTRASGTAAPGQLSGRAVLRTELQVVVIIQILFKHSSWSKKQWQNKP